MFDNNFLGEAVRIVSNIGEKNSYSTKEILLKRT